MANSSNRSGQIIDYGMDPDIVNSSTYASLIEDALVAIPTMSLVTDLSNLFDTSTGIYMNAKQEGSEWERPASLELIYPSGKEGFQINAGIRIRGGVSADTSNPKHAFRVFFRSDYGSARLKYDLFGSEGVDSFDKIDLRTEQNYSWSKEGSSRNTMVREVFSRDAQHAMGNLYTRSRYYHLYIDGQYWGIYQTQERAEAAFAESYLGGLEEEYDVIKVAASTHTIEATDGTTTLWKQLWQAATTGFSTDTYYYTIQGMNTSGELDSTKRRLVDIDNLIDYMILIYYTGDRDAPISAMLQNSVPNNFWAICSNVTPDGFKFCAHDAECSLLSTSENRTGTYSVGTQFTQFNPQWLLQRLFSHPECVMRFADRVQKHLYNGGALSATKASERFLERANTIDTAIIAESARWGDAKATTSLTRVDWLKEINSVVSSYFTARPAILITQLRAHSWFPTIDSPSVLLNGVASAGGTAQVGDLVTLSSTATYVYYTLTGVDPRLRVSVSKAADAESAVGAVSSSAIRYTGAITLTDPTTRILTRAFTGSEWSALTDLTFVTGSPLTDLRVTEIMHHPPDAPDGDPDAEFIELQNVGDETIALTGIRFTSGVTFRFTEGELEPGAYALVVANQTAFETIYGTGLPVYGVYSGRLSNGDESICLETTDGDVILAFQYDEEWQPTTDGVGYSLTFNDPTMSDTSAWGVGENWHASLVYGGTPGAGETEQGPTASFTPSATSGATPLTVTFTDTSSPGSSAITDWAWRFGDGAISTEQSPTHTYATAGTYTVTLTVTTLVASDTATTTITATTDGPTASFTPSATSGGVPLTMTFTDTSTAGSASITEWACSFGDGSTSDEQSPTHTYTVALSVTTAIGSDTATASITASNVAPTAAFTASATSGGVPLTVTFTDASTAGSAAITSWTWAFGDGATSTDRNPSHTYTTEGRYTVSLTVVSSVGSDTATETNCIYVASTAMDVDGSGVVDALDIQLVINAGLGMSIPYDADVDGSGTVDAIDIQLVINAALGV